MYTFLTVTLNMLGHAACWLLIGFAVMTFVFRFTEFLDHVHKKDDRWGFFVLGTIMWPLALFLTVFFLVSTKLGGVGKLLDRWIATLTKERDTAFFTWDR